MLIDSLRRVARLRGLVTEMHVLREIPASATSDRRTLAEAAIQSVLGRVHLPRQQRRLVVQLAEREFHPADRALPA